MFGMKQMAKRSNGVPIARKFDSNSRGLFAKARPSALTVNPQDLICAEMAVVPQVESVFVESAPRRDGFHVFTIVNERDPEVRTQIYRREQAIMDAYKNLEFDFRIIARRNRDLKDVVTGLGEPLFIR
jgi:hypothetical protein